MMYADTELGRVEASPGLAGTCPSCGHPCRPRCGQINIHHWAHHARADCDPWSEPESAWHREWKLAVPAERREVVIGPHRADVVTASGGVVELQLSAISPAVIEAREQFYGERMAWIFDVGEAFAAGRLTLRAGAPVLANTPCGCVNEQCARIWLQPGTECRCLHEGCTGVMAARQWAAAPDVLFRWKHARQSIAACRRPVLLDLGDGTVLRPDRFAAAAEMDGTLYTRTSIEGWLRDGTRWELVTLPPRVPLSYYNPPAWERYRTPVAWRERQAQLRRWVFGGPPPSPR
jgi:competence protein CoiA